MFITNEPLTASLLIQWATAQGWVKEGGGSKPIFFRDENGTVRLKLKKEVQELTAVKRHTLNLEMLWADS